MPGWEAGEAGESGSTGLPYPYKSVVPTGTESQFASFAEQSWRRMRDHPHQYHMFNSPDVAATQRPTRWFLQDRHSHNDPQNRSGWSLHMVIHGAFFRHLPEWCQNATYV